MIRLLPARNRTPERWHNQQGWTRQILREPEAEPFSWRASIADIGHDTLYSAFPGYQRLQVLLAGEGLRLSFADAQDLHLTPPHGQIQFDGDRIAHAHLSGGPVQVFNAIWDNTRVELRLLHRPLIGPMVFLPETGVRWLVFMLAGHAHLRGMQGIVLEQGDAALLAPAAGTRQMLDGGGDVLLLRVETVASALVNDQATSA